MLLEPKDIAQGKFGNCYFLSALAAIVENYPELVYRLFVLEKNPSHIFGVCLFIDGIWKTIALDGCFPISEGKKFYGAQPHHSEIWVLLIEKAWAKIYKTYENIHSGYNE
jgi:calpain-15